MIETVETSPRVHVAMSMIWLFASLVLLACSMVMNYKTGYAFATSGNGWIYGSAAAAADVLLALSPGFFFWGWRRGVYMMCVACAVVWVVTLGFAAQSAIGHAATNRLDSAGQRAHAGISFKDVRAEIESAREARKWVPQHRPLQTMISEIEKHKLSRVWSASNECTDINQWSRSYCAEYQKLLAEKGNAMAAEKLDGRIATLVAKSDAATGIASSEGDPQAYTIAKLLGSEQGKVQSLLIFSVVLMILACASLGPYVALERLRQARHERTPPPVPTATLEAIELQPEPDQPTAALPPPRAPLSTEARGLLTAIGVPDGRVVGELRPKDQREVLGWRFLAWLTAYGYAGSYTPEEMDALYAAFAAEDHRDPWHPKTAKTELALTNASWVKSDLLPRDEEGRRGMQWTLRPPSIARISEPLRKRGIIAPEQEASGGGRVVPFFGGEKAPGPTQVDLSWAAFRAKIARPREGWEEQLISEARQEKCAWQMRTGDRKQRNRMSRVRAA